MLSFLLILALVAALLGYYVDVGLAVFWIVAAVIVWLTCRDRITSSRLP